MYKKIILSLMLLPIFSSNQLLCTEPSSILLIYGTIANIVTPIVHKIIQTCCPTSEEQATNAEAHERLNYIEARVKFRKCVLDSKPENGKTTQGIPLTCKELARILVACGGKDELIKMISDLEELDN